MNTNVSSFQQTNITFLISEMDTRCRRKSALPKYDPPYAKRQMMKGYSHPNSPHPSQITPDHTFDGGMGSKMSLAGMGQTTLDRQIPGHEPIPPLPPGGQTGAGVGYPPATLPRHIA